MKELQSMLCGVACPGVPSSVECFTAKVTVTTLMYIKSTLFQHYILFDYLFTEEQEEEVISTKVRMQQFTVHMKPSARVRLNYGGQYACLQESC